MMARRRISTVALAAALCCGLPIASSLQASESSLAVIVNGDSGIERVALRDVRKLFLGKSRRLPNGARAVLARYEPGGTQFNEAALDRSDAQVAAVWSRLRFSGRSLPPRVFADAQTLLAFVEGTRNAIAFLPAELAPRIDSAPGDLADADRFHVSTVLLVPH